MTYKPQKARYTLPFAGKDYELEGSFDLLETVENAMQEPILRILPRIVHMQVREIARLISAILQFHKHPMTVREAGDVLTECMGVSSDDYATLCLHLYAFLRICVARPEDREEAAKQMGELLKGMTKNPYSPGENTGASA